MNILFVQQQPCIRALKYAKGFMAIGQDIKITFCYFGKTFDEFYGQGDQLIEEWIQLDKDPEKQLCDVVENKKIDLIHCHNAPDTLTAMCIDLFKGKIPIIHDIHDLMSARNTAYEDGISDDSHNLLWKLEEKKAIEECDALISVSQPILDISRELNYLLPNDHLIYPNYIPEEFIPQNIPATNLIQTQKLLTVVYEGFISSDPDSHYYFVDIFKKLLNQGIEVHVYPSRNNELYNEMSKNSEHLFYHDSLEPDKLFQEITKYDFGWCGFNDKVNKTHLDTVLPNKFFEYIACGLPVLSYDHQSIVAMVERYGIGKILKKECLIDINSLRSGYEKIINNIKKVKYEFTVENNIGQVLNLYHNIIERQLATINLY